MPRKRGQSSLGQTWPLIRALRHERFDRSVDFATNDRGAIASLLIGAKSRLGWETRGGFLGRKFCYTERVPQRTGEVHESIQLAHLLSGWKIPPPHSFESEIRADPALAEAVKKILPMDRAVICHVASSQPKKEWPLSHWAKLNGMAIEAGYNMVFTTARGEREQSRMLELRKLAPEATAIRN